MGNTPAGKEVLSHAEARALRDRSASAYDNETNTRQVSNGNKASGKEPVGLPAGNSNQDKNKNKPDRIKYFVTAVIVATGLLGMAKCKSDYDNLPQFSGARLGSSIPTRPPVTQCYDQQLGKYINPGEKYSGTDFVCKS